MYAFVFGFGETESFDQIFHDSGFEGSNFIVGIGPLFIVVVLFLLWMPLHVLLRHLVAKYGIKLCCGAAYVLKELDFRFRSTTFAMESCLEFGLTSFISIVVAGRTSVREANTTAADYFAYALGYVALGFLVGAPVDLLRATYQIHHANEKIRQNEAAERSKK